MSPRRRHILQLIHDSLATTGVSPSIAELAARFGTSGAAIVSHIAALIADGWLTRKGGLNDKRSLQVMRLPGRGLLAAEIAWCHANAERVRAMIALIGGLPVLADQNGPTLAAQPAAELTLDLVAAAAGPLIDGLRPGETVEITLPTEHPERLRAYHRVSLMATRRWGRGAVTRKATPEGVRLLRKAAVP